MVKSKNKFPSEGEFIVAKVVSIERDHVYVVLLEYSGNEEEEYANGMIHISEITSRWVKNIRTFVRQNQIIVLKVNRVNEEKGQVDVSLRRVTVQQKKLKMKDYKYGVKLENLLTFLAEDIGKPIDDLIASIVWPLQDRYESFQKILEKIKGSGSEILEGLDLEPDVVDKFVKLVKENIEVSTVLISGNLILSSINPNGIIEIKAALKAGTDVVKTPKETKKVEVQYRAAPNYRLEVTAKDYVKCEAILADVLSNVEKKITKVGGIFEFSRDK